MARQRGKKDFLRIHLCLFLGYWWILFGRFSCHDDSFPSLSRCSYSRYNSKYSFICMTSAFMPGVHTDRITYEQTFVIIENKYIMLLIHSWLYFESEDSLNLNDLRLNTNHSDGRFSQIRIVISISKLASRILYFMYQAKYFLKDYFLWYSNIPKLRNLLILVFFYEVFVS